MEGGGQFNSLPLQLGWCCGGIEFAEFPGERDANLLLFSSKKGSPTLVGKLASLPGCFLSSCKKEV